LTVCDPVDQFGEAAMKFGIEDHFRGASAHGFIVHQRIKLMFQQVPFGFGTHLSSTRHDHVYDSNDQIEQGFIRECTNQTVVPLQSNETR
jgi:hypothetical protein